MHNLDFKTIARNHPKAFEKLLNWMRVSPFIREYLLKDIYKVGDLSFKNNFHSLFPVNRTRDLYEFFDTHKLIICIDYYIKIDGSDEIQGFKVVICDDKQTPQYEYISTNRIEAERNAFIKAFDILNRL
jgi:hypothetical protein